MLVTTWLKPIPPFKAYYGAKMTEGRTHYNALDHYAVKLVRIIYKMFIDKVEFNLS